MKISKKIKHTLKTMCATVSIVALFGQPLFVFAADPPTAAEIATSYAQSSATSTALKKGKLPSLAVVFDKTSVKAGDTITAVAAPIGFAYDDDSLYYTWFLKHNNGSDDPNDWKVEAAKIAARGGFIANKNESGSSYTYKSQPFADTDKGYEAKPRWQDDKDQSQNCYLQDFKTGDVWEISSSDSAFNCPSGSEAKCVRDQAATILPVECPENGSTVTTTNVCLKGAQDPTCATTDSAGLSSAISCAAGYTARCLKDGAPAFSESASHEDICNVFNITKGNESGLTCDDDSRSVTVFPVGPDGVSPVIDVSADGSGFEKILTPQCKRERKSNSCKHLFPDIGTGTVGDGKYTLDEEKAWGTNPAVKSTAGNGNNDEMNLVGLGNSTFTWTYQEGDQIGVVVEGAAQQGTQHDDATKMISWAFSKNTCPAFSEKIEDNPDDAQYYTDPQGNADAGILNIDSFDPNDCLKDNLIDPAAAGTGNLMVSLMHTPQSPANFAKDASGASKGDTVTVVSNVSNVVDSSDYYYKWIIEGRSNNDGMENIDDNGWRDISSKFDTHTPLEGIGKSKISFKMDLSNSDLLNNPDPNIRVRLMVQEAGSKGSSSRSGFANTVIKIANQKTGIVAYGVNIENGKPVLDKSLTICDQNEEPCMVAKNEIVGVVLPNDPNGKPFTRFSWKNNNNDLQCDSAVSTQCTGGNTVFFPVIGQENDSISISVKAKTSDTDTSQEYSKTFAIVKPYARIFPADSKSSFKVLDTSVDLDGNAVTTYSDSVIQATSNSDIALKAMFFPKFIQKNTQYTWSNDGQMIASQADDTNILNIGDQGTISNVAVAGTYVQPTEVRKALRDIWGISAYDSGENALQAAVQVESVLAGGSGDLDDSAIGSPSRFYASLVTDLPSQFMFFLRIGLTMALLLLVTGVLFSIIPGATESEKRRI